MSLSVIILSGRFDEKVCYKTSKSLLSNNNGVSLIEKQLDVLSSVLIPMEVVVVTTNSTERIYKKIKYTNCRIVENQLYDITNEVEDIRLGLLNCFENQQNRYLIINSNALFTDQMIYDLIQGSSISVTKEPSGKQKAGLSIIDNKLEYVSFDLPYRWNNITYLVGKEAKIFKSLCLDKKKNTMFMFEILNLMIEDKCKFRPVITNECVLVNSAKEFPE